MTGWNLPPGVSESMIPGNEPESAAWNAVYEMAYSVAGRYGVELVQDAMTEAFRDLGAAAEELGQVDPEEVDF